MSFRSKEDAVHFAEKQGLSLCQMRDLGIDLYCYVPRLGLLCVRHIPI